LEFKVTNSFENNLKVIILIWFLIRWGIFWKSPGSFPDYFLWNYVWFESKIENGKTLFDIQEFSMIFLVYERLLSIYFFLKKLHKYCRIIIFYCLYGAQWGNCGVDLGVFWGVFVEFLFLSFIFHLLFFIHLYSEFSKNSSKARAFSPKIPLGRKQNLPSNEKLLVCFFLFNKLLIFWKSFQE
jgi:hypothetical protein